MSMNRSSLLLWAGLLVTLWLTWQTYQQEQADAAVVANTVQPSRMLNNRPMQKQNLDLNRHQESNNPLKLSQPQMPQWQLNNRTFAASQSNLFATPTQIVPPSKAPSVRKVAPIKVLAPPLPFQYLGRMQAGDSAGVLLNVNGEVTPIEKGDILLGQYLVQSITDNGAGLQIQFLYQPLNQTQTLFAALN